MTTGKTARILKGHRSAVHTVAFSPCGNLLASGSRGDAENLRLWDVASGQTKNILKSAVLSKLCYLRRVEKSWWQDPVMVLIIWMCDVRSGQNDHTLEVYCFYDDHA